MFGDSIFFEVKYDVNKIIDNVGRLFVMGIFFVIYFVWWLVKCVKDRGMFIVVINMGGVRGEEVFFIDLDLK